MLCVGLGLTGENWGNFVFAWKMRQVKLGLEGHRCTYIKGVIRIVRGRIIGRVRIWSNRRGQIDSTARKESAKYLLRKSAVATDAADDDINRKT